jgi:hypothetical protein
MHKIDPHGHAARQGILQASTLPVVTQQALRGVASLWTEKGTNTTVLPCITVALFMVCLASGHA